MSALTRIGFLRHDFLPPSETFIYTSMRALDRYQACPFAIRRRSEAKFPADDVVTLEGHPFGRLESWLYSTAAWSPRFARWARSVKLIHAHMGFTGAYALGAARRNGLPLVTSYYGADVTLRRSRLRFKPEYWRYGLFAHALWRHGDRFLVLSAHMRDDLVAQGCPADKVRVVPLGVDFARFAGPRERRATSRPTVLMVGREVDKKGFDDGLAACAAARDAGVDLRVSFLGMGKAGAAPLKALAARLGLEVDWLDPATPVPGVMAAADILLVPSRTAANGDQEGTPTVICEGSAAALPIVSTRHAGIPEQVADGETGLLAPERDVAGLAAHLVSLARDADLRHTLGLAGREKMQREYSLAALRNNLQSVYDELLR